MDNNYIFYKRLQAAVDKSGKSINCIERELGYARNSLNNYKRGGEPSAKRLIELSQYFQVAPEYLIGLTNKNYRISSPSFFEQLSEEQKLEIFIISQQWGYSKIVHSNW